MIRKTILSLICAIYFIPSFSQSWDEIKHNSSIYLYGEGWGTTVEEADQQALAALISKISVVVLSNFSITEDERTTNGTLDANSYTSSKLQTYSSATLTNTERLVIGHSADEAHIGRYIKRSELNLIFDGRIRTLKEYIRLGFVAQNAGRIDDALRNYYWAYSLLKSVQHPAEVSYTDEDAEKSIYPLTWLPETINNILDNLQARVIRKDDSNIDVMFTYKGNPVNSLDFTYFDGRNWSNICSVKNGLGSLEFTQGTMPDNVQIGYEYAYHSQAHINQEMKSVLDVVKGQSLRKARVNLNLKDIHEKPLSDSEMITSNSTSSFAQLESVSAKQSYQQILDKIIYAIKTHSYNEVSSCFTENGMEMFKKLIMYGNARILSTTNCELYRYGDDVVARSIQMSFSFKKGNRKNFVEDVIFTFNKDNKIDCLAFGLDKKAKDDIMNKGTWPAEARQALLEFLENYKTAYSLKRLDYLRTIFDDDAVIIVGHVAERFEKDNSKTDGQTTFHNNKYVKLTQLNKEQYLRNLEACFRSNEFVNIRFENNDVRKAKDNEEYGIQIKQDYYSTNYGDQGYLYLQVDLNNRKQPIIKVRTWQPEPDPKIGLFGLGNF